MPLISSYGLDDVYKQLKGRWREIRAKAVILRTSSAAGPVTFSTVRDYYERLFDDIAFCEAMIAKFGASVLQAYARAQEDANTYNPATEYAAMRTAANAVLTHIATALPLNSAHTVSNGRVVEPSFTTVQTSTLRSLLDTLVGTIGAP